MEFLIPIVVVPTVLTFIAVMGPFRRSIIRWLESKGDGGAALHQDLLDQQERLAEAERRIVDLEERVDFAERLLTSGRQAE